MEESICENYILFKKCGSELEKLHDIYEKMECWYPYEKEEDFNISGKEYLSMSR